MFLRRFGLDAVRHSSTRRLNIRAIHSRVRSTTLHPLPRRRRNLALSALIVAACIATTEKVYLDVAQPDPPKTAPSGTSVPDFPVYRSFLSHNGLFELLGIGIRKVTFIGVEAYVLGLYVPRSTISKIYDLPISTDNRDEVFKDIITKSNMAALIVPVRNTDLAHIRDGFIRSAIARRNVEIKELNMSPQEALAYRDAIDEQLKVFKDRMPHQKLKKAEQLALITNAESKDIILEINGEELCSWDGSCVKDLRRLIFGAYLVGNKVVCEDARKTAFEKIKGKGQIQSASVT